jgi:hypothetical protein
LKYITIPAKTWSERQVVSFQKPTSLLVQLCEPDMDVERTTTMTARFFLGEDGPSAMACLESPEGKPSSISIVITTPENIEIDLSVSNDWVEKDRFCVDGFTLTTIELVNCDHLPLMERYGIAVQTAEAIIAAFEACPEINLLEGNCHEAPTRLQ